MFIFVIIFIAVLSVLLAVRSLKRQGKVEEIKNVKKELKRKKIIYHKDSSSE